MGDSIGLKRLLMPKMRMPDLILNERGKWANDSSQPMKSGKKIRSEEVILS